VTGVRLVPSAVAALVGTLETVLGPVWVWLAHGETPSDRTVLGGCIVLAALIAHHRLAGSHPPPRDERGLDQLIAAPDQARNGSSTRGQYGRVSLV